MKKARKLLRIIFGRTAFVVMSLLLQISILLAGFRFLSHYMVYIYGGFTLLSAFVILYVVNKDENPSFKLAWIIPITVIPVFGTLLYLFLELQWEGKIINRRLRENISDTQPYLKQNPRYMEQLAKTSRSNANLAAYIENSGSYPVYGNTNVKYYPVGEEMFEDMKKELEKAKRFIFMEYFIVERGEMWDSILEILERKVQDGVEVRFMYDDVGCVDLLPYKYYKELERCGISCVAFNPIIPLVSTAWNNRDHRKVVVIDGHTAYTGGLNLADEYINRKERFGYWKDAGLKVIGDAVWNFTVMFLQVWNAIRKTDEGYGMFVPHGHHKGRFVDDGFIQPYADNPLDTETVGENVYLNIINAATDYVYIYTPYLIIDNEMMTALCLASKRGVDVRIVTPGIPDKPTVFLLTQSYYAQLVEAGVKVYQYTPGFIHAKCFVSDDVIATVGTINMDYRSLYLHFENGVFMYHCLAVTEVKIDMLKTFKQCELITKDHCQGNMLKRLMQSVLRVLAPLL